MTQISHQLKRDDLSEPEIAWQQVAGLEESSFSGDEVRLETTLTSQQLPASNNLERLSAKPDCPWTVQVAQAGLVPVLVALLEQVPCPSRAEVQDQAACLLLEVAASDLGMVHFFSTPVYWTPKPGPPPASV